MAITTVDGQAMELEWIRDNKWNLKNSDYYLMCTKKTSWYTASSPCRIGAMIGFPDITEENLDSLTRYALNLGLGFQIQDDVLNLIGDESEYGKEINGDLLEGKRTLIMIILFNSATRSEKSRIKEIFAKKRASRSKKEIQYIRSLIDRYNCIERSVAISKSYAYEAIKVLDRECDWMENKAMKDFLRDLALYVVERHK